MKITANRTVLAAAGDDPFSDMGFDSPDTDAEPAGKDSLQDSMEDLTDALDDIDDSLQNFEEDNVDIETENNITDHFIAECEQCHGVFITAIVETDQQIDRISGVCPLCDADCDQYLKWVIKDV